MFVAKAACKQRAYLGVISHIAAQNPCTDGGLSDQCPYKSTHKKVEKPMRRFLITLGILAGCSTEANHLGNPVLLPFSGISTGFGNAVYNRRRGEVEVFVKSNHNAVMSDIASQGGPTISEAMDIAGIPVVDRPARLIQLKSDQSLYSSSPDALIVALMVYAG